jgi:RNA-directed DNA polymerase
MKSKPENNWKNVDWLEIQAKIFQIQTKIYYATKNGYHEEVHKMQTEIINSRSAKLLSVKRVTQDNKGKKTAGIDGVSYLSPEERYKLACTISINDQAKPIKRVMIPKPGTKEKRPLGIPTIEDRAKQALAKLALEPQWEALFESHSFGFRPGRKCADATWQIRHKLKYGACWVYDADIAKCFDQINHQALLEKLNTTPVIKSQMKAWLEAGIFEKGEAFPSLGIGTPQGGVLSPLLANIALDGAQKKIWEAVYRHTGNKKKANKVLYIRYADDFVIISPEEDWLEIAIETMRIHIASMGLEIKPQKTRILHTLDKNLCIDGKTSFDFLGFTFSQRKVGKYKAVKLGGGKGSINIVPVVLPARNKIIDHFKQISTIIKKNSNSLDLIREVNPVLRGWRNYYKFSDSRTYGKLPGLWDSRINVKLRHWIKRQKGKYGRSPLFWTSRGGDNWVFYATDVKTNKKIYMDKYSSVSWSLQAYNRIDPQKSPYDGNIHYWSQHSGYKIMGISSPKRDFLLRQQKGFCVLCKKPFTPDDFFYMEIDHKTPRAKGGSEKWNNSRLLHKECHSKIHKISCKMTN